MSDSPGPGGDAETFDLKTSRLRPAEGDDGIEAVPTKCIKVDDAVDDQLDADDDAAMLDDEEEQDFDEDDEDGAEEDEDQEDFADEEEKGEAEYDVPAEESLLDETGDSSENEDYMQGNLADIDDCQTDIEALNKQANDEILKVEQKYNKLRQPVYTRRNKYIDRIPNFWATVFSRHPQLKRVLTKEDVKCLKYMTNLQIDDFEDSRSGYRIRFSFGKNSWFSNPSITKEYHLPWHDSPSCECTVINWYSGMDLTKKPSSFFSWFCSQEDASTDDIAEIIKEELWPNPLQSYLMKENGEVDSTEESDEDEGPVYVDDDDEDDVEYVSSEGEGEEWEDYRRPPALGKEAPSTSKNEEYQEDDENDGDVDYEEGLEEDDADIDSRGPYGFEEEDEIQEQEAPLEDLGDAGNVSKYRQAEEESKLEDDLADISSRGEYGYSDDAEAAVLQQEDGEDAKTNNISDNDEVPTKESYTSAEADSSDTPPIKTMPRDLVEDTAANLSTPET